MNPVRINFAKPAWVPDEAWNEWRALVKAGKAQPTAQSLGIYVGRKVRLYDNKPQAPRQVLYKTAEDLGRREFNAFAARIQAGLCDPRFVVGSGVIMWEPTRLAVTRAGM